MTRPLPSCTVSAHGRMCVRLLGMTLAVWALALTGCAPGDHAPAEDGSSSEYDASIPPDLSQDGGVDSSVDNGGGRDAGMPSGGVIAAGVRWFGRVDITDPMQPRFAWSGTGFVARFSGTSLTAELSNGGAYRFKTVVDGTAQPAFTTTAGKASYPLAMGLAPGTHTVELYRQTEGGQGGSQLASLTVGDGMLLAPPAGTDRLIEVIGDSISCGYGLLGKVSDTECFSSQSHWDTYAAVAARQLSAEVSTVAASGRGVIRNYGGDMMDTVPQLYDRIMTNEAAPLWDFRVRPQAVIINLGTNDINNRKGDPGMPFRDAYLSLVQKVRMKYPDAFILCMIGPLLSGTDLTTIEDHIKAVVDKRKSDGDKQIAFLDKLMPQTSDKYACSYHPNAAQNILMADLVVDALRAQLGW